jgi:hypothetical protein
MVSLVSSTSFRETLEVLTVVNSISSRALYQVSQDPTFYRFSLEMILHSGVKWLKIHTANIDYN